MYSILQNSLLNMSRLSKRLLLLIVDFITLSLSFWMALIIRQDSFFTFGMGYELTGATSRELYISLTLAVIIIISALIISRLYRSITRYITIETYAKITTASLIGTVLWGLVVYNVLQYPLPRSAGIIFFFLSTLFLFLTRYSARSFLMTQQLSKKQKILIYGTSVESIAIADFLKADNNIRPLGFISNNDDLKKTIISGLPVFNLKQLNKIVPKKKISEILITSADQKKSMLVRIFNELNNFSKLIRKVPNIHELTNGTIRLSQIEKIKIEDLLGREPVQTDPYLLKACIENKNILITGAGGSIGSEMARNIIKLNPKKVIFVEQSEYLLYEIDREITEFIDKSKISSKIKSYLGSVTDRDFVEAIFQKDKIHTIYHAAANKHVPLVEHNPLAAIRTNIIGTNIVATTALKHHVENFVLISSDKAVRPTNIMGATKRFAELILQALQDEEDLKSHKLVTKFCMVRFGNVLDTSGSVVPLFKKQIDNGGPITVTHPEVIRYFMTIREAVELVIQAGSLSKGGEVFLLDMGEPMNIMDLAKEMIKLSGKEIKDKDNPAGDIEIVITGLRDGEKLYEELLIGDNVNKTIHPCIMSANEEKLDNSKITNILSKLDTLDSTTTISAIKEILFEHVSGYQPSPTNNIVKLIKD